VGDLIALVDGKGNSFTGKITSVGEDEVLARITCASYRPRPVPGLWVAQALPKGKKLADVLRWAVELEMDGVYLLETARSIPRVSSAELLERGGRILVSELKVSNSAWMPELEGPGGIEDLLDFSEDFSLRLLAWEQSTMPLSEVIGAHSGEIEAVIYAVGPEGGFSDNEASKLVEGGFRDINLGTTRMRTETAQAYLGSVLRYSLRQAAGAKA
jgi:16S rRNA (uracil1498-N3)-methyltransferase